MTKFYRTTGFFTLILSFLLLMSCGGTSEDNQDNTVDGSPTIERFAPLRQSVGRPFTLYGTHFDPSASNNKVLVNGIEAKIGYASTNSITAFVPQGATKGPITLTTPHGQTVSKESLVILGGGLPLLTSFSPSFGPVGTTVTLTGENFDATMDFNEVYFNGTKAEILTASQTKLEVTVPEAVSGNLMVTNLNGSVESDSMFLIVDPDEKTAPVIDSFTPLRGSAGDTVTISGENFDSVESNLRVRFDDVEAVIQSSSETSITVLVPDASSGTLTVATAKGIDQSEASFEVIPEGGYTKVDGLLGGAVQGTVLSLTGTVTTFAGGGIKNAAVDGTGTDARFDNPTGIATDGAYLYIADNSNRLIRRYEIATGEVTTLAGSGESGSVDASGTFASFVSPNGVTFVDGNLYVTDSGDHKIRKIQVETAAVTTFAGSGSYTTTDAVGELAGFKTPYGITSDGDYLYVADYGGNTIRKIEIASQTVTTLAGSGGFAAVDGTGVQASFNRPQDLVAVGQFLYIADRMNHLIRKLDTTTAEVTTFAGSGEDGSADGPALQASFSYPDRIAANETHLFVSDAGNHLIRMIDLTTGAVQTLAGTGLPGSEDNFGERASLNDPKGMAVVDGELFFADAGKTIRKIILATAKVITLAGEASVTSAINGIGTAAIFSGPFGITTDGVYLYIAETKHKLIRMIDLATAKVSTLAGSGFLGSVDAASTSASFHHPFALTTDGENLYIADTYAHKIRKIDPRTGEVTTFAGFGEKGDTDGKGKNARFFLPSGITNDGTYLYVSDSQNHKIKRIEIATAESETFAGTGEQGSHDGSGSNASFDTPGSLTTDGVDLYVADTNNHVIRRINLASKVVSTFAGSGEYWFEDGTGTQAGFRAPWGITTDGTYLYLADSENKRIRKIEIATGAVTTLAGSEKSGNQDGVGTAASFTGPAGIVTDGTSLYLSDHLTNQIRKID